jgi:hypothetical protein
MDTLFGDEQTNQRQEPALDITSHAFQPKKFIQKVLTNVPHAVFEGELVDKVGQAEEDTGEALKQLIRDNLAVFVNSKDAMDAVYHSDQELFTGEALDGITNSFKTATSSCDALVQPITTTFVEVQKSRKSQDMLDKLFSVLGVPGAIYECCGAKVATRRVSTIGDLGESDTSVSEGAGHGDEDDGGKEDTDRDEEDEDNGEDDDDDYGGRYRSKKHPNKRQLAATVTRGSRGGSAYNNNVDSDEDEEREENDDDDDDDLNHSGAGPKGGAGGELPSASHGTLENPGGTMNLADVFVFSPEEELYFWYGTPLVRLKDVDERRHHVEEVSNYEAAVLHLRRAMLYVEETYSLIDGTMLAGEDGDVPLPTTPPAGAAAAGGGGGSNSGRATPAPQVSAMMSTTSAQGTARRSLFAYKFSMALLRSAVYLCSQLAEELVYANPADTVLIEDTLSMMMDASIASVKLHHFCGALQQSIELTKQNKESLTKLRTQLGEQAAAAAAASAVAALGSPQREMLHSNPLGIVSPINSAGNFELEPPPPPPPSSSTAATDRRRRPPVCQHPVQYFISIVQKQHRHLFYASAAALLQEANAWMWKAQTDAARGLEERHRQRELQRKLRAAAASGVDAGEDASPLGGTATFGHTFANSFLGASVAGEGGFIGNSNDSFLQDTSFGWVNRRGGGDVSNGTGGQQQPSSSSSQPRRQPSQQAGSPLSRTTGFDTSATNNNMASFNNVDAQQYVSLVPEALVTRLLDSFNTPESPFPTVTEFKVGGSDMDAVLLSSCLQIRMHAASLLSQLFTRADVESAVMAQATSLNSFALRLCAECVGTLEHVVGSYWGGIATTLHAGVFDFAPDGELKDMLTHLLRGGGGDATAGDGQAVAAAAAGAGDGGTGADGLQRSPSTMLGGGSGGMHSRTSSGQERGDAGGGTATAGKNEVNSGSSAGGAQSAGYRIAVDMGSRSTDQLPRVRFVPVLPQAFLQQEDGAGVSSRKSIGDAAEAPRLTCLRDISVQAVRQMIATATTTLQSLFLTFINRGVADGFLSTMARYRVSDAERYSRTERMELHAAVLYEILLGQWERMMNLVSDSVLRLKIVMGESSSSSTLNSDSQVEEVGNLLQELEVLRSACLKTYLHGVGMLSKTYLTILPLLQRRSDTSLDARVRSRLSRESVSSNVVHKLLNVLSVVVDRCVPFFTRDTEVFDSVDLFSVKAESIKDEGGDDEDDAGGRGGGGRAGGGGRGAVGGRRLRLMRSRRGGAAASAAAGDDARRSSRASAALNSSPTPSVGGPDSSTDPVSDLLAQFHSKLVMESLQDHEELVLALLSHLLLAFVDMLQLKCRTMMTDVSVAPDERERSVVECVADTLTLATTLTPILMEHLLVPCFFELIVRQLPEVASSPAEVAAYLESKQQQYVQVYLAVVEEHCQLAVDAMMNTYLALAQQPITDFVRRQGFVQPLFDWQRVSPHTTAAVRPYIADAVACIARAHETLNAIRQPILGSAATQRLVAHLVRVFLTSFTSDINVFELSVECSSSFLVFGLTLLEAEALTILKVVDTVVAHAAANPTSSELSGELVVAKESLSNFAQSLDGYANSVCESIAAARGREGVSEVAMSLSFLSRDKRHTRRDEMVQAAVRTLGYMLEAINVELEESSLSSAGLLQLRSSVTESIVQRLEHRSEGYELRRAKAAQKVQERKDAERRANATLSKRKKPASATAAAAAGDSDAGGAAAEDSDAGGAATGRRRLVHRRPEGLKPSPSAGVDAAEVDDAADAALTPRSAQEHEKEASSAVAAASNVLQLAQDQQQKAKVRRVRKVRKAAPALEMGGTEAPSPKPTLSPHPAAVAVTTPAAAKHSDNDEGDGGAPVVRVRPVRRVRRGVAAASSDTAEPYGAAEPRERRVNRFRRSNVV